MNAFEAICSTSLVQAVGQALIHFSWQGLLIGSLLSMTLIALRKGSPRSRYAACLAAMLLMLAAPIVTTSAILAGVPDTLSEVTWGVFPASGERVATGWTSAVLPWFMGVWFLSASFLQTRLVVDWLRAQRAKRVGVRVLPRCWQPEIDELRKRLGIVNSVPIFESPLVDVPAVVGCLRPFVLIPIDITTRLAPLQLRAIIAHEFAHIRRHDCLVNFLQGVFESVLFFHPVVWWVSNQLHTEREYCCDDVAVSVSDSALNYAQALSSLEELRGSEGRAVLASTGGSLMKRIARISGRTPSAVGSGGWMFPAATLAGVVALMSVFATGCDTQAGGAALSSQPEAVRSTNDQESSFAAIAASLEDCRDRQFLTDDQLEVGIVRLKEMAAAGDLVGCDEINSGACRIMVMPGEEAMSRRCPDGKGAMRVKSTVDLKACIRGMENLPESSTIKVEEVDLGGDAALALIRIEDGDAVK